MELRRGADVLRPTLLRKVYRFDNLNTLELAFDKRPLRELCESRARAKRELGEKTAKTLENRISDFIAANNVSELVAGHPKPLATIPQFAVELTCKIRIVFCANHSHLPLSEGGKVDWSKVSRIKILRIEYDND
jgi:hypothetical protein